MPSPTKDDTMADKEMDQTAMIKYIYQKISLMDGLNSRVAGLETSVSGLDNRLKVMEERISSSAAAGFSGRHEAGNDSAAFHEDKVLARVPKKLVDEDRLSDVLHDMVQRLRNGARYTLDIIPWTVKPGANGSTAAGGVRPTATAGAASDAQCNRAGTDEPTVLVDILLNPQVWKSFVTLGKIAREQHGIILMDALTKTGKQLHEQRMATFIHLRDVKKVQPRWERGVDITVMDGQCRVPFEGPWVDAQPSGAGGSAGMAPRGDRP
ncbi:hypothetical protein VOLCADRAFT_99137 [Volvox carteri f. nagariensis]|uniref:Uncharacterized protein n=1 Tax=Volvox carteri f. nagariensis TaxID=3068 RepID=D8UH31_VOLCA|nr:uncharacterized protein VOLCADRAFT_99137 [Volvox carteri f. nagariensis]EFJ40972.1 hypothetical protein VOLCADRAFT_99137 [Volvox carteri f. nagariensis]|eukprot:XP_002957946.1 hypothetical protein VOLCADRAFT_99137 [Volvox carteri f. nagariensis]